MGREMRGSAFALALVAFVSGCGPAAGPVAAAPAPVAAIAQEKIAAPAEIVRYLASPEERYVELASTLALGSRLPAYNGRLTNWPVTGRITSPFGPRWGGFHTGIDIAAPLDTPVVAAAPGQVMVVGKPYLAYGDTATIVIIAHASDLATLYVHLTDGRPPVVKIGQHVSAGEVIAYCGSTGFSTGPHVHFMTVLKGRAVDPMQYLP